MANTNESLERAGKVLIGNYARLPIMMVRGEGCHVYDAEGRQYLDLFAGFGGGVLGHCHPALVQAVREQAGRLWHVGNTFHTEPQIGLGERLNRHAFDGRAFFCHSGAEANEAACKLARLRGSEHSPKRWNIISLSNSFHGRTLAMIAATGNPKVREGFEPDVPGFIQVPKGDFEALRSAVDEQTAGIIMEPIQGEGGINEYPEDFARQVRSLCDEKGLTLIFDEVWTGMGRTGRYFGHQWFESVTPDIMTLGKAIGGGLPVGVMFARPELAKLLVPGKHGCTLGGNPICMSAANAVFDVIEREHLCEHALKLGDYAIQRLRNEPGIGDRVQEVRGRGLFLGIELRQTPVNLVEMALKHGIIINLTAGKVIRLAPPINISRSDWEKGLDILTTVLTTVQAN